MALPSEQVAEEIADGPENSDLQYQKDPPQ
jgi:hypothetical protein